jgi:hypothetical protein
MSRSDAASLTADLLATKGEARPIKLASPVGDRFGGDRLGLAAIYGGAALHDVPRLHPLAPRGEPQSRMLFRIDEQHRHRLRLAAAHLDKSSQAVLMAALDHYLTRVVPTLLTTPCPCIEGAERVDGRACCGQREIT